VATRQGEGKNLGAQPLAVFQETDKNIRDTWMEKTHKFMENRFVKVNRCSSLKTVPFKNKQTNKKRIKNYF